MTAPLDLGWEWDLAVVLPLALSAALYTLGVCSIWRRAGLGRGIPIWRSLAFAAGWMTLVAALDSPLHQLGEHLFVAHMIEHELLIAVAAPLFAVSRPLGCFLRALPSGMRTALISTAKSRAIRAIWQKLMNPLTATVLHGVAIWAWHVPAFLDATLVHENLHRFQHATFLGTALIFWWAVLRRGRRDYGIGAMHVFITMVHTSLLGALLTLAPRVFYPLQTAGAPIFGLTPLQDQQLAGLFMWVPGGAIYLIAGLALAGQWLGSSKPPPVSAVASSSDMNTLLPSGT